MLEISVNITIAIFVAFLSGIIRGYAGFASGLFLVPLFTLLFVPIEGIAIAAIASSAGGVQLLPSAIRGAHWPELLPTLISAACAVSLGVVFLVSNEPAMIKTIMGIFLIAVALILIKGWSYQGPRNILTSIVAGLFAGGSLGGLGLPAGQFFALYFVNSSQQAKTQRANIIICASITVFFLLGGLIANGQVNLAILYKALIVTPAFMLGTWLGTHFFQILPINWFLKTIHILLMTTGISLIIF